MYNTIGIYLFELILDNKENCGKLLLIMVIHIFRLYRRDDREKRKVWNRSGDAAVNTTNLSRHGCVPHRYRVYLATNAMYRHRTKSCTKIFLQV